MLYLICAGADDDHRPARDARVLGIQHCYCVAKPLRRQVCSVHVRAHDRELGRRCWVRQLRQELLDERHRLRHAR